MPVFPSWQCLQKKCSSFFENRPPKLKSINFRFSFWSALSFRRNMRNSRWLLGTRWDACKRISLRKQVIKFVAERVKNMPKADYTLKTSPLISSLHLSWQASYIIFHSNSKRSIDKFRSLCNHVIRKHLGQYANDFVFIGLDHSEVVQIDG